MVSGLVKIISIIAWPDGTVFKTSHRCTSRRKRLSNIGTMCEFDQNDDIPSFEGTFLSSFLHLLMRSLTIFRRAGIWADNLCPASQWNCWKSDIHSSVVNKYKYISDDISENFTVALEASLLGQLFIFRTIFQPLALSSDIPAAERGLLLPIGSVYILEAIEKFWFDGSTHRSH